MTVYNPPIDDIAFTLRHVCGLDELLAFDHFEGIDSDMVVGALDEFGRFAAEVMAPLNEIGDQQGSVRNDDSTVSTPDGFPAAYQKFVDAGWGAVPFDQAYGGGGFPWVANMGIQEMLNSANLSLAVAMLLTQGAIDALWYHGTEEQRETYLPKMITGEWSGTMNLTEPDAGSDVGALRTKAEPVGDGSYKISGTKIYISWGEHDMVEQIVHLVLARTPDSPPGTKGISLFLVPKMMVNDDGSLGDQNDVSCLSVEHKMGLRASPTCVLSFGETGDGAIGWLIGEEHQGMKAMFTMMNNARLSVGNQGLGVAERAYQQSVLYAQERQQGRAIGAERGTSSPIIDHADIRRTLMTMRARIEAMRALVYYEAAALDRSHFGPEADRDMWGEVADLLTPMAKSWCTDVVNDVTSANIQVHGGMGYVEETGAAQHYRDARITAIYEGTNGIQAIDLVGRKLPMRGGGVVSDFIARMRSTVGELESVPVLAEIGTQLAESLDVLETSTKWLLERIGSDVNDAFAGATPYQRMFSVVTGAWLLGVSALAAHGQIEGGGADTDEFLAAKIVTARFFAGQLLPEASSLARAVTAGANDLFEIPVDAL